MNGNDRDELSECIRMCWECRTECMETLFIYCPKMGDEHTSRKIMNALEDCVAICQVTADFMTRVSPLHPEVCEACAEVCEACADACERLDDDEMDHCAMTCRRCADLCERMAESGWED